MDIFAKVFIVIVSLSWFKSCIVGSEYSFWYFIKYGKKYNKWYFSRETFDEFIGK